MKKLAQKKNILQLFQFKGTILFNEWMHKNLWFFNNNSFEKVYDGEFNCGVTFDNYFYFIKKEGDSLRVFHNLFDTNGEVSLDGVWFINPYKALSIPNSLQITNDCDNQYVSYLMNIDGKLIKLLRPYDLGYLDSYIYNGFHKTIIESYSKTDETLFWKIDTSQYGIFKEPIDDGFTEHPNTIDRPIFGGENCVYVPMKGGQLLALNASDGSLKWMLEMEYSGFYGIYEDRIYKNSNHILYEIDANSGSILRSLEYRHLEELKGLFGFSADFRVYEDYIILKDQIRGWVAMFDRKTMTLAHLAETWSRIGSDASYFHWIDNKLYVLDRENTLHIFEI